MPFKTTVNWLFRGLFIKKKKTDTGVNITKFLRTAFL